MTLSVPINIINFPHKCPDSVINLVGTPAIYQIYAWRFKTYSATVTLDLVDLTLSKFILGAEWYRDTKTEPHETIPPLKH